MKCAYVTLVTNEDYVLGAKALGQSIRRLDPVSKFIVLTTRSDLAFDSLEDLQVEILQVTQPQLSAAFLERHTRERQHAAAPFTKGNKPKFHNPIDNFCKLRLWELTQFDKLLFIDADAVVVKDVRKLFAYPEFSAAPNLYETLADMHRLNSGVFVAKPSQNQYDRMISLMDQPGNFWRRTDQTFLEYYFPDWHGLPYTYNALQYIYFNLPELWHWPAIHIVHYQYEKTMGVRTSQAGITEAVDRSLVYSSGRR